MRAHAFIGRDPQPDTDAFTFISVRNTNLRHHLLLHISQRTRSGGDQPLATLVMDHDEACALANRLLANAEAMDAG